jgi:hypothetical protein
MGGCWLADSYPILISWHFSEAGLACWGANHSGNWRWERAGERSRTLSLQLQTSGSNAVVHSKLLRTQTIAPFSRTNKRNVEARNRKSFGAVRSRPTPCLIKDEAAPQRGYYPRWSGKSDPHQRSSVSKLMRPWQNLRRWLADAQRQRKMRDWCLLQWASTVGAVCCAIMEVMSSLNVCEPPALSSRLSRSRVASTKLKFPPETAGNPRARRAKDRDFILKSASQLPRVKGHWFLER